MEPTMRRWGAFDQHAFHAPAHSPSPSQALPPAPQPFQSPRQHSAAAQHQAANAVGNQTPGSLSRQSSRNSVVGASALGVANFAAPALGAAGVFESPLPLKPFANYATFSFTDTHTRTHIASNAAGLPLASVSAASRSEWFSPRSMKRQSVGVGAGREPMVLPLPYSASLSQRIQHAESNKPPSAVLQSLYVSASIAASPSETQQALYTENQHLLTQSLLYTAYLSFKASHFHTQIQHTLTMLGPLLLALLLLHRPRHSFVINFLHIAACEVVACFLLVLRMLIAKSGISEQPNQRIGKQWLRVGAAALSVGLLVWLLQCLFAPLTMAARTSATSFYLLAGIAAVLYELCVQFDKQRKHQSLEWEIQQHERSVPQTAVSFALTAACQAVLRAALATATINAAFLALSLVYAISPFSPPALHLSHSCSLVVHQLLPLWKIAFVLAFIQSLTDLLANWALTQPIKDQKEQNFALQCIYDSSDHYYQLLGWHTALSLSQSANDRKFFYQTAGQLFSINHATNPLAAETALYFADVAVLCHIEGAHQSLVRNTTLPDALVSVVSMSVPALINVFVALCSEDQRGVACLFLPAFVSACTELLLTLERLNFVQENFSLHSPLFLLQERLSQQLHVIARSLHRADKSDELALPARLRPRWLRVMSESRPLVP